MSVPPRWVPLDDLPESLAHVDPPVEGLWALGAHPGSFATTVAIVGARRATRYGLDIAFGLGADLAARGVCVVSGLALGCDGAAHRGALSVGGQTLAVLAGGADVPYPAAHAGLYRRILDGGGTIVSEQPPRTSGMKHHFKLRNRLIAALGLVLVVVQGRVKGSGASGTVGFAQALGRPVMGVPGDVRSVLSSLPHELIAAGGSICRTADDVLSEFGDARASPSARLPDHVAGELRTVAEALLEGPSPADVVAARTGLDLARALAHLTRLELIAVVERAGPNYRLVSRPA